jgi:hypothetical protein
MVLKTILAFTIVANLNVEPRMRSSLLGCGFKAHFSIYQFRHFPIFFCAIAPMRCRHEKSMEMLNDLPTLRMRTCHRPSYGPE